MEIQQALLYAFLIFAVIIALVIYAMYYGGDVRMSHLGGLAALGLLVSGSKLM